MVACHSITKLPECLLTFARTEDLWLVVLVDKSWVRGQSADGGKVRRQPLSDALWVCTELVPKPFAI